MRSIFFIAFTALALSVNAQTVTVVPTAQEVSAPALAQASKEKKNVLLIFHASWCGWCRKMDSSLADPAVKPAVDRSYVVTHLTVLESPNKKSLENAGAEGMMERWGGKGQGLPYWVVLDANGKLLHNSQYKPGENTGCPASAEEVGYFIEVLKKTSAMTEEELERVRMRFRKNDG